MNDWLLMVLVILVCLVIVSPVLLWYLSLRMLKTKLHQVARARQTQQAQIIQQATAQGFAQAMRERDAAQEKGSLKSI